LKLHNGIAVLISEEIFSQFYNILLVKHGILMGKLKTANYWPFMK